MRDFRRPRRAAVVWLRPPVPLRRAGGTKQPSTPNKFAGKPVGELTSLLGNPPSTTTRKPLTCGNAARKPLTCGYGGGWPTSHPHAPLGAIALIPPGSLKRTGP